MSHRKTNPLVKLACIIPKEIDAFAERYDRAVDKEKLLADLGDLLKLRKTNWSYMRTSLILLVLTTS